MTKQIESSPVFRKVTTAAQKERVIKNLLKLSKLVEKSEKEDNFFLDSSVEEDVKFLFN